MPEVRPGAHVEQAPARRRLPQRGVRSAALAVFVISCALHLHSWYGNPDRPSLTDDAVTGWYGSWSDQINYAREARALAEGQIPGTYWDYERGRPRPDRPPYAEVSDYAYGLGYPILGVPFMNLGLRRDPFVLPDMLAFAGTITMAWLLARRFLSEAAALLFAGALAVASPVLAFTVMPWNTTTTMIAVLAALVFATSGRRDWTTGLLLGLALSLCYAARFVDAVWPVSIAGAGVVAHWRTNVKGSMRVVLIAGALLLATCTAIGWTQHAVFGSFFTNPYHYHLHNGNRGDSLAEFNLAGMPGAFTQVFITGLPEDQARGGPRASVVRVFPWIAAAPLGFWLLVRRRSWRTRWVLVFATVASAVSSMFYLSYWSGSGAEIVHNNMRFFVPWFPLWGLLAAVAFARLVPARVGALVPAQADAGRLPADGGGRPASAWTARRIATHAAVVVLLVTLAVVWRANRPVVLDLVQLFPAAARRPADTNGQVFAVRDEKIAGEIRHAIYARPPSRITWTITVPDGAWLRMFIGIDERAWGADGDGVVFRVGVSDGRAYRDLLVRHLDPRRNREDRGWVPIALDLAPLAGRRLDLIFNTHTSPPGGDDPRNDFAYWGAPDIRAKPYAINVR